MNVIGKTVVFKPLIGPAKETDITKQSDEQICIEIGNTEKRFQFPDAFATVLKFKDKKLQDEVEKLIAQKNEAIKEEKKERRDNMARELEERQLAEAERIAAAKRSARQTPPDRNAGQNNLVFKCNFCDGGCSDTCIGYKGVCSEKQIKENIKLKRKWCSDAKSPCLQYIEGKLTYDELVERNSKGTFVCYEARMLTDWKAEAGDNLKKNGKARRITNNSKDSLVFLSTVTKKSKEQDRFIFGAFIAGNVAEGNEAMAGYVKANPEYTVELTPDEAKEIKFWHYYKNKDDSNKAQWGSGLFRYMKDETSARILADIVEIKKNDDEKERAKRMLEYYCNTKRIDINNIPEADGVI